MPEQMHKNDVTVQINVGITTHLELTLNFASPLIVPNASSTSKLSSEDPLSLELSKTARLIPSKTIWSLSKWRGVSLLLLAVRRAFVPLPSYEGRVGGHLLPIKGKGTRVGVIIIPKHTQRRWRLETFYTTAMTAAA